ncbi:MAG TPA: Gfo/Idh/MocA family oxidoreductase [Chloroflexota bacterium]|nr:Gfo/Idh/MocA family oxidoreductase [Chloroflexota bacterium]
MLTTVAIVGLSHPHSDMYLETLEALDEVVGVVLVDPDEATLRPIAAQTRKLRGTQTDLQAALEDPAVTHVLVALPNDRTPAALVQAIDAGKGVLTEKPGARSAAEFEPVLAALQRSPVPFAIAYLNRWSPPVQQMRELYRAGAIGRLTSVELRMVTTQVGMRNPDSWLFHRAAAGGGVLAWLGCHWLDALRFVTGAEIVRVQAELATTSGEGIDVEDTAAVAFRTAGGAVGSMHAGYLLAVGNPGYRAAGHDIAMILRGTLGAIYYTGGRQEAPLLLESIAPGWRSAARRTFQFTPTPSPGYGGLAGLDFFRSFLRLSSDLTPAEFAEVNLSAGPGDPTPAGALDALRLLEVLDAIYAAGASGRALDVERRAVS